MKQKLGLLWLFLIGFSLAIFSQIQIGKGNDSPNRLPINGDYDYSISQQIVLRSEYDNQGGAAGNITKIRWCVISGSASKNSWNTWTIYLAYTKKDYFLSEKDWIDLALTTLLYNGTISPNDEKRMKTLLMTSFVYNGDNLVMIVVDKKTGFITTVDDRAGFTSYTAKHLQALHAC